MRSEAKFLGLQCGAPVPIRHGKGHGPVAINGIPACE